MKIKWSQSAEIIKICGIEAELLHSRHDKSRTESRIGFRYSKTLIQRILDLTNDQTLLNFIPHEI